MQVVRNITFSAMPTRWCHLREDVSDPNAVLMKLIPSQNSSCLAQGVGALKGLAGLSPNFVLAAGYPTPHAQLNPFQYQSIWSEDQRWGALTPSESTRTNPWSQLDPHNHESQWIRSEDQRWGATTSSQSTRTNPWSQFDPNRILKLSSRWYRFGLNHTQADSLQVGTDNYL